MVTSASYTLAAFGGLVSLVSVCLLVAPRWLIAQVRVLWRAKPAMWLAVLLRIMLGTMLIWYATYSRLPQLFRVLGFLGLMAALALPLLGWRRIDNLMAWMQRRPVWIMRMTSLAGVAAGGLVIYGAM